MSDKCFFIIMASRRQQRRYAFGYGIYIYYARLPLSQILRLTYAEYSLLAA